MIIKSLYRKDYYEGTFHYRHNHIGKDYVGGLFLYPVGERFGRGADCQRVNMLKKERSLSVFFLLLLKNSFEGIFWQQNDSHRKIFLEDKNNLWGNGSVRERLPWWKYSMTHRMILVGKIWLRKNYMEQKFSVRKILWWGEISPMEGKIIVG